ncbi:MAG TPA: YdcF family protein [Thermodesulfobacteriota bacterium]|nr:YdcF family protein [Thermodesulfobacteriota bacterium]
MAKSGKPRWRRILFLLNLLVWLCLAAAAAIAFTPFTSYLVKPLAVREEIRDADAIVVLAGGIDQGRYLTLVTSHRLIRGVKLYFEGRAGKILFSGGMSAEGKATEASVMAQEARRLTVPDRDILLDKKGRTTYEEGAEIRKIADGLGFKSILLVTSFSHMKRSVMVFENFGFQVYPAPADPYEMYMRDPLGRLLLFRILVHEYAGIVYYKVRGWI